MSHKALAFTCTLLSLLILAPKQQEVQAKSPDPVALHVYQSNQLLEKFMTLDPKQQQQQASKQVDSPASTKSLINSKDTKEKSTSRHSTSKSIEADVPKKKITLLYIPKLKISASIKENDNLEVFEPDQEFLLYNDEVVVTRLGDSDYEEHLLSNSTRVIKGSFAIESKLQNGHAFKLNVYDGQVQLRQSYAFE